MTSDFWVTDANAALLTDAYELTMLQAYWREEMFGPAAFSLYVRRLPQSRNYLLACGLDDVLRFVERLRFDAESIDHLATLHRFDPAFLDWLARLRFTGSVWAVPEGTPVFAEEPLLEVEAPLPEAQLLETFVMNQVHFQTVAASKAARVVQAAAGRQVVDFGLRRIHGADAGLKAARAFHIAGVHATSNVLAGKVYGIPTAGTLAHSYVQAHATEMEAFRSFAQTWPDTILLVDTYDTLQGVRNVVALAKELGERFHVRGIRLDSGDLGVLATGARAILDEAGLQNVRIFASGGLDEHEIERLIGAGAPIDAFGVGSLMGVSADAPYLDTAYKLVEYAGHGRTKLAPHKRILPGRKQVFRLEENGEAVGDVIGRASESLPGRPLLVNVMRDGVRTADGNVSLEAARRRAQHELSRLPARVRALEPATPPYPTRLSPSLERYWRELEASARTSSFGAEAP
jgi:nicotinate phosphoribosyltransferase